jgi:hypothetical protein
MAEGYVFKISGDVADYAKQLATIPGTTDKAAAAAALKMGQQFAKMQADAAKKSKTAAKDAGDAWTQTAGLLKNSAKVSGFGELGEKAHAAGAAIEAMLSPAGALVAGIGAVGGVAAGAVVGVTALGAALVESALGAEANLKALEGFKAIGSDFYPVIPPATVASFKALAATEDALTSIGERLSLSAASSVAPSLEKVVDTVVGLALEGERLFETFAQGQNLFEVLATQTLAGLVQALTLPMAPMVALGDAFGKLAEITGVQLPQGVKLAIADLDRIRDGQYAQEFAKNAVAAAENSGAVHSLATALSGATAEGAAFISTQERATAAQKNAAKAAKAGTDAQKAAASAYKQDVADEEKAQQSFAAGIASLAAETKKAADAQLTGMDAIKQARADELAGVQATYQATLAQAGNDAQRLAAVQAYEAAKVQVVAEYEGKITEAEKAEAEKREKAMDDAESLRQQMVQSYQGSIMSLAGSVAEASNLVAQSIDPKKHKAAYMAAFAAHKALALAQAGINTFMAVSNALALPFLPPVPEIAAVAAGVAGGVEMASIAAAPPPKFHIGTMYATPAGGLAANEFASTLERGEIVVDRQTASRPGVRESVAAMSTGTPMGGTHPDDVAEGMDRSSVPMLLQALLSEMRRGNSRAPSPTPGRPGHRPSYGY